MATPATRPSHRGDDALFRWCLAFAVCAAVFLAPLLPVAVPVAAATLALRWRYRLLLLVAGAVVCVVRSTTDPLVPAVGYVGFQRHAGIALLDWKLDGSPFDWQGYAKASAPYALGYGPLLGMLGALGVRCAIWRKRHGATGGMGTIEDAGELAQKAPPVMAWLVPDVAGRGVLSLLSGPPGIGKGYWLWALAKAIQSPALFFGLPVRRQRLLWCTEEGQSFEATARKFGILPGLVSVVRREYIGETEWEPLVKAVRRLAWKRRCGIVVFDTVRAWCPQAEHRSEDAYAVMQVVRRELTKPGLGVLFVHHDRKGGGHYGEGVAGTNALVGAVDILIELQRVAGRPNARRMVTSRRFAPLDVTATLHQDGRYVADQPELPELPELPLPELPVNDVAEADVPARLRAALELLPAANEEGFTVEQLRLRLGISRQAVSRQLADLDTLGLVTKDGVGTKTAPYRWTASGARAGARPAPAPEGWDGLRYPPGFDDDAYRRGDHWKRVRQAALERAEGICEDCAQARAVDVHHLHYRTLGRERPEDVIALCPNDHARRHAG